MQKSLWSKNNQVCRSLLREKRLAQNMTQFDLAERLNMRQSYVSKFENGERKLDILELLIILKALETDPNEFITELIARID